MSEALQYEHFIRRAFSINQELIDRWGDPAELANTDVFSSAELHRVKIGVGYAMEIFRHHIANKCHENLTDPQLEEMNNFSGRVLIAIDKEAVLSLLIEFHEKFESQYLRHRD
jgi:hypothetical protein